MTSDDKNIDPPGSRQKQGGIAGTAEEQPMAVLANCNIKLALAVGASSAALSDEGGAES